MSAQVIDLDAERVNLTVGTLKIDVSATCMGTVELDGKRILCRGFKIHGHAGEVVRIQLEVIPLSLDDSREQT